MIPTKPTLKTRSIDTFDKMSEAIRDEESLTGGVSYVGMEKESTSRTFTKRIIAALLIIALAGIAYASSPLQKISTHTTSMQVAVEEGSASDAEASPEITAGSASVSLEQAMFEGMDENKDSFLSKVEFDKFVNSENSDSSLEGFHAMKFEDIDANKDGKVYLKDFTYYLQSIKDVKVAAAFKHAKSVAPMR